MTAAAPGGRGGGERGDSASGRHETGELPLGLGEAPLPWLEGADDDEADPGGRAGAVIAVLLAVLLLAIIAAGVWYAVDRRHEPTAVADGGVIAAPRGPYKVRPTDPGGNAVSGVGDASYLVAEGRPVRAGARPAAAAGADRGGGDGGSEGAAVGVQVGAFSSAAEAEAAWPKLAERYPALAGLGHRVVEERADLGSVFGLQAVSADAGAARSLCAGLRSGGLNCRVKD